MTKSGARLIAALHEAIQHASGDDSLPPPAKATREPKTGDILTADQVRDRMRKAAKPTDGDMRWFLLELRAWGDAGASRSELSGNGLRAMDKKSLAARRRCAKRVPALAKYREGRWIITDAGREAIR